MKKKILTISIALAVVLVAVAVVIVLVFTLGGKKEKGVNILEQPADYVGEFDVPSSKKVEDGSALSVITNINEEVFKINSAIKTKSDDLLWC